MKALVLATLLLVTSSAQAASLDCVLSNGQGGVLEKVSAQIPPSGFIEAFVNRPEYGFISAYNEGRVVYGLVQRRMNGVWSRALTMGTTKDAQAIDVRLSYGGSFVLQCHHTP
jgi:hypothetical protein